MMQKRFAVNGAKVFCERAERGWFYRIRVAGDDQMRETNLFGEKCYIAFGPKVMRGWAKSLRDIRRIASAAA